MDTDSHATLSHEKNYTVFQFRNYRIRFLAPYSLERYISIKEWDQGYLVVETKYTHNNDYIDEYIDLIPILEDLYIDADNFVRPIKEVRISYDSSTIHCK
jgi:hypothetical protein